MVLVGNTSGANCVVTSNNSGTTSIRVKDVSLTKFTTGEHINVKINNKNESVSPDRVFINKNNRLSSIDE